MCLTTKQEKPLVAKEDIICYKFLDKKMKSPFRNFQYQLGKIYTDDVEEYITEHKDWKFIGAGFFHAYLNKDDVVNYQKEYRNTQESIYKCRIPKGTPYYSGIEYLKGTKEITPIAAKSIEILEKID